MWEIQKLCDAHIIPESFYEDLTKPENQLTGFSEHGGLRPRRRPIGAYDQRILCAECDGNLPDQYAFELLHEINSPAKITNEMNGSLMVFENYDFDKLMLFFISLIWRASISNSVHTSLGNKYESQAKRSILKQDPNISCMKAVILRGVKKLDNSHVLLPKRFRLFNGASIWICRTSRFHFIVKASGQDWGVPEFSNLEIRKGVALRIPIFTDEEKEVEYLKEFMDKNKSWNVFR